jgi:hypothetical protein
MNDEVKLHFALQQVDNLTNLLQNNEYESFFASHLIPIHYELKRQLTNILANAKLSK